MADDITHQQILDKIDTSNKNLLEVMTQQLGVITDNMVTKKDLKEELKAFVTKDDLKEELKHFATKDDLQRVETRLERKIESSKKANVAHHLRTRADIGRLNRQFSNLREGLSRAAEPI